MPAPQVWQEWLELMWRGLWGTLQLSLISSVLTILFGVVLAVLAVSPSLFVRGAARGWIELFRAVPVLALMILMYFGFGPFAAMLGVNAFAIAVVALTLSMSAYQAEIFRGAIRGVPASQWSAASSLGMSHGKTLRLIIIPQIIPPMIPAVVNIVIGVIKLSSLASLITVSELSLAATQAVAISFYPLHVYLLLGCFYAVLILPLIYFSRYLEKWTQRRFGLVSAAIDRGLLSRYGDAKDEAEIAEEERKLV
jgi:His/Glu/Gln/Arg/opine family amino acid ABC transporter permease subunit